MTKIEYDGKNESQISEFCGSDLDSMFETEDVAITSNTLLGLSFKTFPTLLFLAAGDSLERYSSTRYLVKKGNSRRSMKIRLFPESYDPIIAAGPPNEFHTMRGWIWTDEDTRKMKELEKYVSIIEADPDYLEMLGHSFRWYEKIR